MKHIKFKHAMMLAAPLLLLACNKPAATEDDAMMQEDEEMSMSVTLEELVRLGKNYTCTFSDIDEVGNTTEGTVYVEGGDERIRGNFTIAQADGENYDAHMIHANNTNYVWTSQVEQGFMMTVDEDDDSLFGSDDAEDSMGMSENEKVDFNCEKWRVDQSLFTPPSDIEFVDIEAQMQMMMEGMGDVNGQMDVDMSANACAACNSISDPVAQGQCKAALNC